MDTSTLLAELDSERAARDELATAITSLLRNADADTLTHAAAKAWVQACIDRLVQQRLAQGRTLPWLAEHQVMVAHDPDAAVQPCYIAVCTCGWERVTDHLVTAQWAARSHQRQQDTGGYQ